MKVSACLKLLFLSFLACSFFIVSAELDLNFLNRPGEKNYFNSFFEVKKFGELNYSFRKMFEEVKGDREELSNNAFIFSMMVIKGPMKLFDYIENILKINKSILAKKKQDDVLNSKEYSNFSDVFSQEKLFLHDAQVRLGFYSFFCEVLERAANFLFRCEMNQHLFYSTVQNQLDFLKKFAGEVSELLKKSKSESEKKNLYRIITNFDKQKRALNKKFIKR